MKLSFLKDNCTKLKNNKDDYYLGEEDFDLKRKRSKSFSELLLPNFKEIVPITVRFTFYLFVCILAYSFLCSIVYYHYIDRLIDSNFTSFDVILVE